VDRGGEGEAVSGRYLIRIDDVCPTIDWPAWEAFEAALAENGVKPIVAVIPDNKDPEFMTGPADPGFWERVRRWQAAGWGIGVHGFEHRRLTEDGGLMGLNARSEFAGLSAAEQRGRLEKALAVFARERVRPDAWVAPWHSFDEQTRALLREMGVGVISDGFALNPYRDADGTVWVPQQLWNPRPMPFGVWTVCWHYSDWRPEALPATRRTLAAFRGSYMSLAEAVELGAARGYGLSDGLLGTVWPLARKARGLLRR
jgi:predicted deacetylase